MLDRSEAGILSETLPATKEGEAWRDHGSKA